MKSTIKGYPINKNGKILTSLVDEVVRTEFLGNTIKQNGDYLFFRFKRGNEYIYTT